MNRHEILFALLVALLALLAVRIIQRWDADPDNPFSLLDLVMEHGRASKGAFVMMGSFAATTGFFVYYTATGRMTEGYFALYAAAWITPTVARLIKGGPPEAMPQGAAT